LTYLFVEDILHAFFFMYYFITTCMHMISNRRLPATKQNFGEISPIWRPFGNLDFFQT